MLVIFIAKTFCLFVGTSPGRFTLTISGTTGFISPDSRVEASCKVEPPHPGAKIRWVNAQNIPVSPDGRLIIERFTAANEGNYVCEAFLPDGHILRQVSANLIN